MLSINKNMHNTMHGSDSFENLGQLQISISKKRPLWMK